MAAANRGRAKRTARARPFANWPADPPVEPLSAHVARLGNPMTSWRQVSAGDPAANLRAFATRNLTEWTDRTVTPEDVLHAYGNALRGSELVEALCRGIVAQGHEPNDRTDAAGVNLRLGMQMLNSALLLHVQSGVWNANPVLVIVRSALDLVGTAALIAFGKGPEATVWERRDKLTDRRERDAATAMFSARRRCEAIASETRRRDPDSSDPYAVYTWLCHFTHFDYEALLLNSTEGTVAMTHEMAYSAFAYVAWACALVAERVTGVDDIADAPRLPARLPWA